MGFIGGILSGALAFTFIVLIRSYNYNAALAEALDRSYLRDGEAEDDIITVKGEKYKRKEFISRAQEIIIEKYRGKFAGGTYDRILAKYRKKYEKLKGNGPKSKEAYYRTLADICTVLSRTPRREYLDEKWKAFFEEEKA